jgi:hypothetical protein
VKGSPATHPPPGGGERGEGGDPPRHTPRAFDTCTPPTSRGILIGKGTQFLQLAAASGKKKRGGDPLFFLPWADGDPPWLRDLALSQYEWGMKTPQQPGEKGRAQQSRLGRGSTSSHGFFLGKRIPLESGRLVFPVPSPGHRRGGYATQDAHRISMGFYPMLIYAERGLAACLEHSSLFKVNLNQLLMPEDRSPPRLWESGGTSSGSSRDPLPRCLGKG